MAFGVLGGALAFSLLEARECAPAINEGGPGMKGPAQDLLKLPVPRGRKKVWVARAIDISSRTRSGYYDCLDHGRPEVGQ
jgi:hypothetical protein